MITFFLYSFAVASPNGAPRCQINEVGIQNGMRSPSNPALGYGLVVDRVGPSSWNIRVSNAANRPDYQGILLYVSSSTGQPTEHLGSFAFRNATKWKFQSATVCRQGGITGSVNSTVTHAIPARVPIANNVNFTWTATSSEMSRGGFIAQAVIASVDVGQTGLPRWQRVRDITFGPAAAAATTTAASVSRTTNADFYPTAPATTATSGAFSTTISNVLIALGAFYIL
jgi:hypothetical protein